jgi:hypothetical protein
VLQPSRARSSMCIPDHGAPGTSRPRGWGAASASRSLPSRDRARERLAGAGPRPGRSTRGVSLFSRLFSDHVKPAPDSEIWKPKRSFATTLIQGQGSPAPRRAGRRIRAPRRRSRRCRSSIRAGARRRALRRAGRGGRSRDPRADAREAPRASGRAARRVPRRATITARAEAEDHIALARRKRVRAQDEDPRPPARVHGAPLGPRLAGRSAWIADCISLS